jgi:lipoprotein-anchoring transpeptidase ErfK/SrfK
MGKKTIFQRRMNLDICIMKKAFRCSKNLLLMVAILGVGLLSCRQAIVPSAPVVSSPTVASRETPPVSRGPLSVSTPLEEEKAARAEVVIDLPPPIPILPPIMAKYLPLPEEVKIIVRKKDRKLLLYEKGELLKMFPVDLGKNPRGPKIFQGDMRTPEGEYNVVERKDVGQTKFYLALLLNYPNGADRLRHDWAIKNGYLPRDVGIGGLIEIHGEGIGFDWTEGCIALDNSHMQELFKKIPVGTPVRIEP